MSRLQETGTGISAPSLLKGWPCATNRGPSGTSSGHVSGSRSRELVPAAGGCWISHLRVQTDQDPSLLASPSPPAIPYAIPMVPGRWSKRYQLGSIYESRLSKLFLSLAQVASSPPPPRFPCAFLSEGWALAGTRWLSLWHRLTAIIFHVLVCPSGMWGRWEGLCCSLLPSPQHVALEPGGLLRGFGECVGKIVGGKAMGRMLCAGAGQ